MAKVEKPKGDRHDNTPSRRNFLRGAVVAAPAMAASAGGANAASVKTPVKTSGLRSTEHTRKYLETTRF